MTKEITDVLQRQKKNSISTAEFYHFFGKNLPPQKQIFTSFNL